MIKTSQENIEKYNLDFKARLYKSDTEEANLYNENLEAEEIANKPWWQRLSEAYGVIGSQLGEMYDGFESWKVRVLQVKTYIPKV